MDDSEYFNKDEMDAINDLASQHKTTDYTEMIRITKHGDIVREDVVEMERILNAEENKNLTPTEMEELLKENCNFLHTYCPDIFRFLSKNTMNFKMMYSILDNFKEIEDGKLTQHQFASKCGKMLASEYLPKNTEIKSSTQSTIEVKEISWNNWKSANK